MIQYILQRKNWYNRKAINVKGYCFDENNKLFSGKDLLNYFEGINDKNELEKKLIQANGIFSLIIHRPDFTAIALDKTRIYPLFYGNDDNHLVVTDNPYTLLKSDKTQFNLDAVDEFKHASFTLGNKTLVKNIYQVRPSSYIIISENGVEEFYYSHFAIQQKDEIDAKDAGKIVKDAFDNSIKRFITSSGKRQLVLPLSGGYDSRLIACLLKKNNYENVVCYNVGRPGNPENILSQKVAQQLGYPYYFINNASSEIISDYINSEDFNEYYPFSGNLCTSFWMYEYFGIKYLKEKRLIHDNAIFIPGHSGDFLGGSQFSKAGVKQMETPNEIVYKILQNRFVLGDTPVEELTKRFICSFVNNWTKENDPYFSYSIFEDFYYKEILPKLINNSARIYEFFGHEVRLFFWDNELLDVFKRLPYQLRLNKKFYDNILEQQYFSSMNVLFPNELKFSERQLNWQHFKNKVKSFLPNFIRIRINRMPDDNCMKEISLPLKKELKKNNVIVHGRYSKVFLNWYLNKIKTFDGY